MNTGKKTKGTPRYDFTLADGSTVKGPVQGRGGFVSSLPLLTQQIARASIGKPLGIYEPEAGHVLVFPDYSAEGNGEGVRVNLVGATVRDEVTDDCEEGCPEPVRPWGGL